jgi:hypothetical protein
VRFLDRIDRAAAGSIAIGAVLEVRLENRLQHKLGGGLNHPIPNRRDAERRAFAASRFRDRHPPHRRGPMRLQDEFLTQARQPHIHAKRVDLHESHPLHAWRARIGASQRIGVAKNVLAANLVVEQLETEGGVRLRLAIELPLKVSDLVGRFEAHSQSPPPRHLRKRTRSQGPFLRRNYPASPVIRPCPTPARKVGAHGDVAPAHVQDPMNMVLRQRAIQADPMRWDDSRGHYVLTGTGRSRFGRFGNRPNESDH